MEKFIESKVRVFSFRELSKVAQQKVLAEQSKWLDEEFYEQCAENAADLLTGMGYDNVVISNLEFHGNGYGMSFEGQTEYGFDVDTGADAPSSSGITIDGLDEAYQQARDAERVVWKQVYDGYCCMFDDDKIIESLDVDAVYTANGKFTGKIHEVSNGTNDGVFSIKPAHNLGGIMIDEVSSDGTEMVIVRVSVSDKEATYHINEGAGEPGTKRSRKELDSFVESMLAARIYADDLEEYVRVLTGFDELGWAESGAQLHDDNDYVFAKWGW